MPLPADRRESSSVEVVQVFGDRFAGNGRVVPPVDADVDAPGALFGASLAERLMGVAVQQRSAFVAEPELGVAVLVSGVAGVGEVGQQYPGRRCLGSQRREW